MRPIKRLEEVLKAAVENEGTDDVEQFEAGILGQKFCVLTRNHFDQILKKGFMYATKKERGSNAT